MARFCIVYDLGGPARNYDKLIKAIKDVATGAFSAATESVWVISSKYTTEDIFAEVTKHIDQDDKLLVIPIINGIHYKGFSKKEVAAIKKTQS